MAQAGSLHQFLQTLHDDNGPITSFWMGQQFVVSVASPELFKEHSKVFDRPRKYRQNYKLFMCDLTMMRIRLVHVIKRFFIKVSNVSKL